MSTILITVGAQADASFTRVFAPLLEASGRARVRVTSDAAQTSKTVVSEHKKTATASEAFSKAIAAAAARSSANEIAEAKKVAATKAKLDQAAVAAKVKSAEKAHAQLASGEQKALANSARLARQAERESLNRTAREQAAKDRANRNAVKSEQNMFAERVRAGVRAKREAEQDQRRKDKSFDHVYGIRDRYEQKGIKTRTERIKDIARGSMQNMAAVGGAAANVGKEGFRAAGVNFDLGTLMQRGIDLESSATATTISAATAKGKIATPGDIGGTVGAIKNAGHASSQDYGELAAGLSDFVSKSGDLETGKKTLADLGLIARATGADVGDLVSAAGDVSKTLADTPDKAERLLAIMRLVAKQGALGSVEIKDLAKYMGNITASAFMFEGGVDKNIGILGGLAQVAMKGGATTAAEGTRSANSFSRDITKEAALKRFEGAGIDVWADKDHKKLKSPEKIITQFMEKTGGSLDDLASLFQNEMSRKVLKGYSQIYDEAGGGEAGIAAIKAKFAQMSQGMTAEEVRASANVSMGGKAAQAQEFQNKLADLGMQLADKLLPALMKLTPTILALADAFVSVTTWAAENPGKAIVGAIIGSIGKAMIGNAVGGMLTQGATGLAGGAMTGVAGSAAGAVSGGAAAMTAALGPLGAALAAGALAIGGIALAGWQLYELSKSWDENSSAQIWKKLKSDVGAGPSEEEQYQASKTAYDLKYGALPPPGAGQPAGTPPTLTAPAPNLSPKLDEVVAQGRAQVEATNNVAKAISSLGGSAPGVTTARTGPSKK